MKVSYLFPVVAFTLITGCASGESAEPAPYSDVDVSTSDYFIALEDEGSDPLTYAGGQPSEDTEFLYEMGLFFCGELDEGSEVMPALESLQENSGLGDDAGSVAGAAVNDLCPDHREKVQEALG